MHLDRHVMREAPPRRLHLYAITGRVSRTHAPVNRPDRHYPWCSRESTRVITQGDSGMRYSPVTSNFGRSDGCTAACPACFSVPPWRRRLRRHEYRSGVAAERLAENSTISSSDTVVPGESPPLNRQANAAINAASVSESSRTRTSLSATDSAPTRLRGNWMRWHGTSM